MQKNNQVIFDDEHNGIAFAMYSPKNYKSNHN